MRVYSASLKGLRPQNEDTHEIILNIDGKDTTKSNINFYAVFDGHGGKEVSAYLKTNLPKFFMDKRVVYPLSKKYVTQVYDHIQKCLSKESYSRHVGSTGLVVIHFRCNGDDYLNVINNGDCRAILCRENMAIPLSKDHKPNWPEERNRLKALNLTPYFDGYTWRIKDLSVSRSFGDIDSVPGVTHRPDLFRYKLDGGDRFVVINCDGLNESMDNNDIINFALLNCYDSTLKNRINKDINIAKKLAETAIKRGSQDNISVIVVFLD